MFNDPNLLENDGLELVRVLGQGAMGVVYEGRDLRANRAEVAVKTMHAHLATVDGFRAGFLHEVNSAARLRHDNIVPIRRFSDPAASRLFLVMDYIKGGNLRDYFEDLEKRGGRTDLFEALQVALQIAQALSHAHDQGYVHRDVKPENILLRLRPMAAPGGIGPQYSLQALLSDFGLAVLIEDVPFALTEGPVGTFAYSSPEQLRSEPRLDGRADIYSLGVVLYELVTSVRPFNPGSMAEALKMHELDKVEPPSTYRHGLPPALESIILRCLAKEPERRYSRAAELVQALHTVYNALYSRTTPMSAEANAGAEKISEYVRQRSTTTSLPSDSSPAPLIQGPALLAEPEPDSDVDNRVQVDQITVADEFLDQVDVVVTPLSVIITPGKQAQLRVTVTNRSVMQDRYRLDVRGVPRIDRDASSNEKQWGTVSPTTMELIPGQSAEATLTFSPPRHSSSIEGAHIYTIRVYSEIQHYEVALKQCEVNLTPFQDIRVELRPDRLYNTHDTTLIITNNGNIRAKCQLRVRDSDMRMGLNFQFDETDFTVAPGKTTRIPVTIQPAQHAYVHGARPIAFQIAVVTGGETKIVSGEMIVMADLLRAGNGRQMPVRPVPAPMYPPNEPTRYPYEVPAMSPKPSIPGLSAYIESAGEYSLRMTRRRSPALTAWLLAYTLAGLLLAAAVGLGALRFITMRPGTTEETVLFVLLWGGGVLAAMGYAVAIMSAWAWRKWAVQVLMFLSFFLFPVGPLLALAWWLVMHDHWDEFR